MEIPELKKILESCHLNFLIGSGASRPFFETLSQVENLLTDLSQETSLSPSERVIIEASIKTSYFNKCIKDNSIVFDTDEQPNPLIQTAKNYSGLLETLHTLLSKRKNNLVSKQANLFTTNMDILIESVLEASQFEFNDGFYGRITPTFGTENFHNTIRKTSSHYEYQSDVPLFNLYKLHGSVNWKLLGDKIIYDYELATLKNVTSKLVDDDLLLKTENEEGQSFSLEELISACKASSITSIETHEAFLSAYDQLVMINPTKQKFETTTRDLTFYELLRMYSNHLERENSVLFVIGFSFADEHIREITNRVVNANPSLLVIIFAYSIESAQSIRGLLPPKNNVRVITPFDDEAPKNSVDVITNKYFEKIVSDLDKSEFIGN